MFLLLVKKEIMINQAILLAFSLLNYKYYLKGEFSHLLKKCFFLYIKLFASSVDFRLVVLIKVEILMNKNKKNRLKSFEFSCLTRILSVDIL